MSRPREVSSIRRLRPCQRARREGIGNGFFLSLQATADVRWWRNDTKAAQHLLHTVTEVTGPTEASSFAHGKLSRTRRAFRLARKVVSTAKPPRSVHWLGRESWVCNSMREPFFSAMWCILVLFFRYIFLLRPSEAGDGGFLLRTLARLDENTHVQRDVYSMCIV